MKLTLYGTVARLLSTDRAVVKMISLQFTLFYEMGVDDYYIIKSRGQFLFSRLGGFSGMG